MENKSKDHGPASASPDLDPVQELLEVLHE